MTRDFLAGLMHVWEILSLAFISFNLRFDLTLKENIHHCSTQILKSTQLLHLHERWNLRVRRSEDTTSLCLGVCAWLLPTAYPDSPPSYNRYSVHLYDPFLSIPSTHSRSRTIFFILIMVGCSTAGEDKFSRLLLATLFPL